MSSIKMIKTVTLSLVGIALLVSCSKKTPMTDQSSTPPAPLQGQTQGQTQETMPPMTGMPMMKEDPRSIKSVEGEIREVGDALVVVHTAKNVTLKFTQDQKTEIKPAGKKLIPGMHVKIQIEHMEQGMKAREIDIL